MSADDDARDEVGPKRRFSRPWEDPDDGAPEISDEETTEADPSEPEAATEPSDLGVTADDEGSAMPEAPDESPFDLFSQGDYVAATTREYMGLAEEVTRAGSQEYERQAVAASIPGVGSGLIGFEDVTGAKGPSEEDVEGEEQRRSSDFAVRVASAIVLISLFLGSLLMGGLWFTGFVTVVMVLSLGELYATVRTKGYSPAALFGFLGLVAIAAGSHRSGPVAFGGWMAAAAVAVAFFYAVAPRRNPLENLSVTVFGLGWVGMLSFAIIIGRSERAVPLILLVVGVTALFDTGAYFVGRSVGKRLLAPRVSPQKTVEGLIGGVVTAFAASLLLATIPLFDPLDVKGALVFAAMVSILAPLGDAAESVIKRALETKDMGSILPGHGGMLDRIDALLFVAPAAYFLFDNLGYL